MLPLAKFDASKKPQLLLFALLHAMCSLAVFTHFFAKKWKQLDSSIPIGAPHYWQKHTVPPIEFGAMHSLLYQMAFLLLSMCRNALTWARRTQLSRYLPLNDITSVHTSIGMLILGQTIATLLLFVAHFGSLCAWHKAGMDPVDGCAKFGDEIMATGYVIVALVLVIGTTSAVRNRIPWEAFKYTHYLFILLYAVTVLHTLDAKGRSQMHSRSQAWFWLVSPLVIYATDCFCGLLRTRKVKILSATLLAFPRAIVLRINRPRGFTFQAGQYVRLNIPGISHFEWHPFNIASSPADYSCIELYIKVVPGGWSERLYNVIDDVNCPDNNAKEIHPGLTAVLDGPHGSTLQAAVLHRNLIVVASGSGVAPIISLLRLMKSTGKVICGSSSMQYLAPGNPTQDCEGDGSSTELTRQEIHEPRDAGCYSIPVAPGNAAESQHQLHQKLMQHCLALQQDLLHLKGMRNQFVHIAFLLCAGLNLLLMALGFSWMSLGLDQGWIHMGGNIATSALIGAHVVTCIFRRVHQQAATGMTSIDIRGGSSVLEVLVMVLMLVINYQSYMAGPKPAASLVVSSAIMLLYRCLHTIAASSLFLSNSFGCGSQGFVSFQFFMFAWACSPASFQWLAPELISIAQAIKSECGAEYFQPTIHIRSASLGVRQSIHNLVEGTPLEGRIHFERLVGSSLLKRALADIVARSNGVPASVGVFVCGTRGLIEEMQSDVTAAQPFYSVHNHPLVYHTESI